MPIAHKVHTQDGPRGGVRGRLRISGRRRRVVVGEARGVFWNYPNTATTRNRKRSAPPRCNATNSDLKSSASGLFGTCLVAFFYCDATAARPGGREHFSCLGCFSTTFG